MISTIKVNETIRERRKALGVHAYREVNDSPLETKVRHRLAQARVEAQHRALGDIALVGCIEPSGSVRHHDGSNGVHHTVVEDRACPILMGLLDVHKLKTRRAHGVKESIQCNKGRVLKFKDLVRHARRTGDHLGEACAIVIADKQLVGHLRRCGRGTLA